MEWCHGDRGDHKHKSRAIITLFTYWNIGIMQSFRYGSRDTCQYKGKLWLRTRYATHCPSVTSWSWCSFPWMPEDQFRGKFACQLFLSSPSCQSPLLYAFICLRVNVWQMVFNRTEPKPLFPLKPSRNLNWMNWISKTYLNLNQNWTKKKKKVTGLWEPEQSLLSDIAPPTLRNPWL